MIKIYILPREQPQLPAILGKVHYDLPEIKHYQPMDIMNWFEQLNEKQDISIATTSEAIVLRLCKLIGKGKKSREYCKVLTYDNGWNDMPMDEEGDFTTEWPDGFFNWRFEELFY